MKQLANIISYLFHPLLITTYGCIIIFFGITNSMFFVFTPLKLKFAIVATVFAFTFLMPLLNLLILVKLNYVSSYMAENRKERTFPYLATALCYFGLFYLIYEFPIWPTVKLFVLVGAIGILLTAIINLWWQISAHMVAIGGMLGVVIALCVFMQIPLLEFISLIILISGLIGFARLYLKAHTSSQVYAGFFIGIVVSLSLFSLAHFTNIV